VEGQREVAVLNPQPSVTAATTSGCTTIRYKQMLCSLTFQSSESYHSKKKKKSKAKFFEDYTTPICNS
jgi:hypothetical protein